MGASNILATMAVQITARNAQFNAAMQQSQTQLQKLNKTVGIVGGTMGAAFGATAVFAGLRHASNVIIGFEKRMSEVRAITGATSEEFQRLKKNAMDLGGATKFTAEEVAELQVAYGRLGFTTKEIIDVTGATLDLATATGEDLAKSADIAGSTLRGFGLESTEMTRVIDVMAESFNASALGLENFAEAMKYVAPVAAAANLSVEETTALLGTLADNGIRGSMAGTSLRKIISDVAKDTRPLNERLKELADRGFTGADAMDEVGRTAYASLLVLVKYTEKTKALEEALRKAEGAAKDTAKVIEDNLAGDITQMSSAMDGFILKFGDGASAVRELTQAMTALLKFASEDEVISFLKGWAALATWVPRYTVKGVVSVYQEAKKQIEDLQKTVDILQNKMAGGNEGPYPALSAEWNPFGSWWGKKEDNPIPAVITSLESLKQKEKELLTQFEQIDIKDKKKQKNISDEIKLTRDKIKAIEDLLEVQKPKELKLEFIYDKEAEGSLNPELRNDQERNRMKEFSEDLLKVATSAEFAGGKVIKLEEATGELIDTAKDIGPLVASSLTNVAAGFGEAAVGAEDFGDVILKSLGGFMQAFGSALIATGVGKIAFDSFSGPQMIAGGAVLVAAGAALQATIQNKPDLGKANKGFSGGSSSSGSLTPKGIEITLGGSWEIKGNDLVYIINRTQQLNGRTGG